MVLARAAGLGISEIKALRADLLGQRELAHRALTDKISAVDAGIKTLRQQRELLGQLAACACTNPALCEMAA